MASAFTHPIPMLALGAAFGLRNIPPRLLIVATAFALLPDMDAIGFRFGIAYSNWLGHRGFSHSLVFALCCGLFGVWIGPWLRASRWLAGGLIFLAVLSHIALDALTNGGLGVAVFWPVSDTRYFFPWRPIQVSPLSLKVFFTTEKGLKVIASELLWVWLPCLIFVLSCRVLRRR